MTLPDMVIAAACGFLLRDLVRIAILGTITVIRRSEPVRYNEEWSWYRKAVAIAISFW